MENQPQVSLSLEKQFALANFRNQIQQASLTQAQELALTAFQNMLYTQEVTTKLLKDNFLGLTSENRPEV